MELLIRFCPTDQLGLIQTLLNYLDKLVPQTFQILKIARIDY